MSEFFPIEIARDRSFILNVTFDFDVTSWTVKAQVRRGPARSDGYVADLSCVVGEYTSQVDPETDSTYMGTLVTLSLTGTQTRAIIPDDGYWDLMVITNDNDARTYLHGPVLIVDYPTER